MALSSAQGVFEGRGEYTGTVNRACPREVREKGWDTRRVDFPQGTW